ncbi:MAG: YraN family protein [Gammaproteobacteria bacterium]|nr:YraN family protein [Gammaproteobacteria bacterium]
MDFRAIPAKAATNLTGRSAEDAACRYLVAQGLTLLERNFRCRCGEIDLVMRERGVTVMVEVRYRLRPAPIHPAVTITFTKRRRILDAAALWLRARPGFSQDPLRFDVMAVSGMLDKPRCEWLRAAFDASDSRR